MPRRLMVSLTKVESVACLTDVPFTTRPITRLLESHLPLMRAPCRSSIRRFNPLSRIGQYASSKQSMGAASSSVSL